MFQHIFHTAIQDHVQQADIESDSFIKSAVTEGALALQALPEQNVLITERNQQGQCILYVTIK